MGWLGVRTNLACLLAVIATSFLWKAEREGRGGRGRREVQALVCLHNWGPIFETGPPLPALLLRLPYSRYSVSWSIQHILKLHLIHLYLIHFKNHILFLLIIVHYCIIHVCRSEDNLWVIYSSSTLCVPVMEFRLPGSATNPTTPDHSSGAFFLAPIVRYVIYQLASSLLTGICFCPLGTCLP